MRRRNILVLGLTLLVTCSPPLSWGQAGRTPPAHGRMPSPFYPEEAGAANADQRWVSEKWIGDERPYMAIKGELDAALAGGTSATTLVTQYGDKARASMMDQKAQFAWAYATQLQAESGRGIVQPTALYGLRRATEADCYPVARLRFLLTQELESNNDHLYLATVGHRLLKRDPNDRMVRRALIQALSSRPAGLPEALKLAQEDVALAPTKPGRHVTLAGVYETLYAYSRGRNATYRQRTIQEYQAYLKYAKPDDSFRPQAVRLVKVMKTEPPW